MKTMKLNQREPQLRRIDIARIFLIFTSILPLFSFFFFFFFDFFFLSPLMTFFPRREPILWYKMESTEFLPQFLSRLRNCIRRRASRLSVRGLTASAKAFRFSVRSVLMSFPFLSFFFSISCAFCAQL